MAVCWFAFLNGGEDESLLCAKALRSNGRGFDLRLGLAIEPTMRVKPLEPAWIRSRWGGRASGDGRGAGRP